MFAVWSLSSVVGVSEADFDSTIADIFSKRCIECHNSREPNGELNLTQAEPFIVGGASGKAVVPGNSDASLFIARIESGEMPPPKNGKSQKLHESEIQSLREWVNSGAVWPQGRVLDLFDRSSEVRAGRDWWSFQPIQNSQNSATASVSLVNPIDAFIAQKLAANGLSPAPAAEKRILLRRLYQDLIGLPPLAEDIDTFVADDSPNAYERQVDDLLARPQFGERWARHWLDVVRYADTNGYERDAEKQYAWRYRDWVVNAFNSDMPYDRFLTEQLAGDELPNRNESNVIATGFLRLGTWDDEPNDVAEYQYERLEDLVHTASTAFLGLTVKCARCHDHKFDPIYQDDYYRIGAAFWPGPVAHRDRALNGGPTKEELGFDVLGWTDININPSPLRALKKGDIHQPLHEVPAGPLSSVQQLNRPFVPKATDAKTTQRRLQLAQWMTDPSNPLTARVMANRVWQHHFGEGLVRTPDNFGFNGQRPSHPELLDWLATDLMAGNWQLKRIHKLIVMSDTYQQSVLHPQQLEFMQVDAANHLLWHANRRRLDAESLRDAILFTSGQLDLTLGGPSFRAPISGEALEGLSMKGAAYHASEPKDRLRRSLYMFNKRGLVVPFMTAFDICDSTIPTGRRESTVVATQALAMLNNDWVHEQSRAFASRVLSASEVHSVRIDIAWQMSLGRKPTDHERAFAEGHLRRQQENLEATQREKKVGDVEQLAWASLCHVLLNTNEFLYLD
jgi:hypothetical protein